MLDALNKYLIKIIKLTTSLRSLLRQSSPDDRKMHKANQPINASNAFVRSCVRAFSFIFLQ